MMLKILLFDVDGVIVGSESFSLSLERDYGITREMITPFFKEKFYACLIGRADLKECLKDYLHKWGWQQSVNAFLAYWFQCEHNIDESLLDAVQGMRQQGIRCCLATNQEKYRTQYMLTRMGFAEKFDGVFSSAQLGYTKSDKSFFEKMLRSLPGIQPDEMLFWDDTQQNVDVARELGLNAEVYTDFDDFAQKTAEYFLPASVS
jgi:putative hydrolase of the HAD superfamily